jgi:hypothetical protein
MTPMSSPISAGHMRRYRAHNSPAPAFEGVPGFARASPVETLPVDPCASVASMGRRASEAPRERDEVGALPRQHAPRRAKRDAAQGQAEDQQQIGERQQPGPQDELRRPGMLPDPAEERHATPRSRALVPLDVEQFKRWLSKLLAMLQGAIGYALGDGAVHAGTIAQKKARHRCRAPSHPCRLVPAQSRVSAA